MRLLMLCCNNEFKESMCTLKWFKYWKLVGEQGGKQMHRFFIFCLHLTLRFVLLLEKWSNSQWNWDYRVNNSIETDSNSSQLNWYWQRDSVEERREEKKERMKKRNETREIICRFYLTLNPLCTYRKNTNETEHNDHDDDNDDEEENGSWFIKKWTLECIARAKCNKWIYRFVNATQILHTLYFCCNFYSFQCHARAHSLETASER